MLEIVINFPMQIPDNEVTYEFEMLKTVATYSLDDIITCFVFVKLYIILRSL